ncbi:RNA ligase/cyclic nucleotide phosphodiesterase [Pseudocohnilembus persalinus]|uniref:RNA ligase/cyclic nucleotide phosphodiesterase n=1 Tax=Pseudocohnilembus persalinus TaxID=266149 RepID=A0A0V0QE73_PSEPJ|nr:RNA ligase/cyclic nucleotide phosphodiesterase [Pseudocohnilembus persalinus]|eukprot:KRX00483.1 RNA ligase/cyclic nucleotide phosphodiesterase [Pseudocohnilembus persalinus]
MESNQQNEKATWTALVISPPQDKWDQIQDIRKKFDKAYDRWMPHINICFPFVRPEKFNEFVQEFQKDFENLEPFKITLNKFQHFDHGKKSVMYLEPETSDKQESIKNILKIILKKKPFLNDQNIKSENGFTPHLTCGQFGTANIEHEKQKFQKNWKPIEFKVEEVFLISREGTENPFKVIQKLKLGCDEEDF